MKCYKCTNKSNNVLLVAANDIEELQRVIKLADDCHVLKNDCHNVSCFCYPECVIDNENSWFNKKK